MPKGEDPVERGGHSTGPLPAAPALPSGEADARLVWATAPCLRPRAHKGRRSFILSGLHRSYVHELGLNQAISRWSATPSTWAKR